jgi:hypothetical protein
MRETLPRLFWIEFALMVASAGFLVLTIVWPQWIETFLGLTPDDGDGSSEWGITLSLVVATVTLVALTGREWRKTRRSPEF